MNQRDTLLQSSLTAKIKDELVYTIQSKNANSGERCYEMNDSVKEMKDKGINSQQKGYNMPSREQKKYFNKVITIALNKLLRKQLKLNINSPDYIVAFKEQDFADFILELRECALKLDGGE